MIDDIKVYLKDLESKSPFILIGEPANVFKSRYNYPIANSNNLEDIKKYIQNRLENHKLIVLDADKIDIQLILFCLDNLSLPFVLLSSNLNIDNEILYRVKTIFKSASSSDSLLLDSITARKKLKEEAVSNLDYFYAKESPELYYFKKKYRLNKYMDLFSNAS